MGVLQNGSKWMVYNGKSYLNGRFRGTPISGNLQIFNAHVFSPLNLANISIFSWLCLKAQNFMLQDSRHSYGLVSFFYLIFRTHTHTNLCFFFFTSPKQIAATPVNLNLNLSPSTSKKAGSMEIIP